MTEMKNNVVNTDDVVVKKQNQFVEVFKRLRQRPSAMVGLTLLTILILIALLSPWIIPYNYAKIDVLNANQPPSSAHWFGTDQIGRDILSRCMYGARYSLTLGILAMTSLWAFLSKMAQVCGNMGMQVLSVDPSYGIYAASILILIGTAMNIAAIARPILVEIKAKRAAKKKD